MNVGNHQRYLDFVDCFSKYKGVDFYFNYEIRTHDKNIELMETEF